MTPDERCMVDTNVLVYSTVTGNPWHQHARGWLTALRGQGSVLCVSPQILREYLVVLTRGQVFEVRFTVEQAVGTVEAFLPRLRVFDETDSTAANLRDLVRRYQVRGKHIHDANIVATMMTHGLARLATYNQKDFDFREVALEPIPQPFVAA
jgi:toxin-antitoxin system PIN domain toxin